MSQRSPPPRLPPTTTIAPTDDSTTSTATTTTTAPTTTTTAAPTQRPTDAPAARSLAAFTTDVTGYKLVIAIIDYVDNQTKKKDGDDQMLFSLHRAGGAVEDKEEEEEDGEESIYLVDCKPIKKDNSTENSGNSSCTVAFVKREEAAVAVDGANKGKIANVYSAKSVDPTPAPPMDDEKIHIGVILGIVGAVIAIVAVVAGALYYRRRRRRAEGEYERFRDVDSEIRSNINHVN